jgi:hypothetical protein
MRSLIDPRIAQDDRRSDLEHVGGITVRAVLPTTKLRRCAGCGRRFMGWELHEVTEDHESLTHFPGDPLCRDCAVAHGIL